MFIQPAEKDGHVVRFRFIFSPSYLKSLGILLLITVIACGIALGEFGLRTLGDRRFGTWIFIGVCLCIAMIFAETLQFLKTRSRLRQLLIFLDRLRLRRTLAALKGISWESVWKMSGNVLEQRYRLISLQFEGMRNLENTLSAWTPSGNAETQAKYDVLKCLKDCADTKRLFCEMVCGPLRSRTRLGFNTDTEIAGLTRRDCWMCDETTHPARLEQGNSVADFQYPRQKSFSCCLIWRSFRIR